MNIKEGTYMRIKSINHTHDAGKKLIDMGLTPDSIISIKKIAPLGDPYIIEVRSYLLAVRKKDLHAAELEIVK